MLVFAIKGNVMNYVITSISMAIKRLLLNVIIEITFIAHALLYILPDPPYMAILPLSFLIILCYFLYIVFFSHVFCATEQAFQVVIPIVVMY